MEPRYVTPAGGMRLVNLLLLVSAAGSLLLGVILSLLLDETAPVWVSVAALLITDGFIWVILPQRYEVYDDHMRLAFGFFGWDIAYDSIEAIRPAGRLYAYAYWGLRFATAPSQAIEVRRRNGNLLSRPSLIISPSNRDEFLRNVERFVPQG